jgi:hypothetical protein
VGVEHPVNGRRSFFVPPSLLGQLSFGLIKQRRVFDAVL